MPLGTDPFQHQHWAGLSDIAGLLLWQHLFVLALAQSPAGQGHQWRNNFSRFFMVPVCRGSHHIGRHSLEGSHTSRMRHQRSGALPIAWCLASDPHRFTQFCSDAHTSAGPIETRLNRSVSLCCPRLTKQSKSKSCSLNQIHPLPPSPLQINASLRCNQSHSDFFRFMQSHTGSLICSQSSSDSPSSTQPHSDRRSRIQIHSGSSSLTLHPLKTRSDSYKLTQTCLNSTQPDQS